MVLEPATTDEAAAILADAARAGRRVAIRGGGSKSDWGAAVQAADVTVSTLALNRIVAHRHGDLTATVEAGARLDDVNRELARHRQWIPLDPAWSDRATIGGIVATNDSGPRRHRYGAPRDLIIGVEFVRADGVRARAGGIVVKNVAGYDLSRLMTGSFGSLALVTSATFKLYPLTQASRTVVVDLPSHTAASTLTASINGSQLTPTAVELQAPPLRLLIRFESTAASVAAQSAAAASMAASSGGAARVVDGEDEAREWRTHSERPWNGTGVVLKVTLLPSDLPDALDAIRSAAAGHPYDVIGRAGVGVILVRIEGDHALQARAVEAFRSRVPLGKGSVTVLRGRGQLGVISTAADADRLMLAVRRSFDPSGVFANRSVE